LKGAWPVFPGAVIVEIVANFQTQKESGTAVSWQGVSGRPQNVGCNLESHEVNEVVKDGWWNDGGEAWHFQTRTAAVAKGERCSSVEEVKAVGFLDQAVNAG